MQTSVLVRVQAKGGKFIGSDGGNSQVTVRDANGKVLAQGLAAGGSGNLSPDFSSSASRQVIVTTPTTGVQTVQWLSALPATNPPAAGLTATFDLAAPTLATFTAEALTNDTPNGHTVTETMWLVPGADLTQEPGVVLEMPGLIVRDITVYFTRRVFPVRVTAWVSMMCGCKIDPSLPWLPNEFAVTLTVAGPGGNVVAQVPMGFQTTSTFASGPFVFPLPGTYTLAVDAVQASEGNVGHASTTFTVPPFIASDEADDGDAAPEAGAVS